MLTCDKIDILEEIGNGSFVMRVTLSDGRTPLWIYDQTRAMEFLNKEVIVVTRKDMYKGELQDFIATFTIPTLVNVLPKSDTCKLYLDVEDNHSNVSFSEIAVGETRYSSLVYCSHCEFKASAKAIWQELTVRDKTMHVAKLRVFNYTNECADFTGTYVLAALTRTPYGFQSDMISPAKGVVAENPEINLALDFITNFFSNNAEVRAYLSVTGLLEKLKSYVDYEPGYALMRMAMELSMADSMKNITKDVDLQSIEEAILCSYGYLCKQSVLSSGVNNVVLAMNIQWKNKAVVLQLLDNPDVETEELPERTVYTSIKSTVNSLLHVRKGVK